MKKHNPVIITGATGGIGKELVRMLAIDKIPMILACRDIHKAETLRSQYPYAQIRIQELDLSSLESIEKFATSIEGIKISALINNAGIIASQFELTKDGCEMNAAVNYFGVWALTNRLINSIESDGSIINIVSCTVKVCSVDDYFVEQSYKYETGLSYNRLKRYGESKRALLLSSAEMASRFNDIRVIAVDPGIVNTNIITMKKWFDPLANIFFRPFIKSPKQGALPIYRALNDNCLLNGKLIIYKGSQYRKEIELSDKELLLSKTLWEKTENKLSIYNKKQGCF